jgi:hypothetical protein
MSQGVGTPASIKQGATLAQVLAYFQQKYLATALRRKKARR